MRSLGDPDVLLDTDLVIRRALNGSRGTAAHRWAPWRSYATHHLWHAHAATATRTTQEG
jgi:AraC family transcriptional regulator of adaptative response / DNA-3-methyladenine glycosylase II